MRIFSLESFTLKCLVFGSFLEDFRGISDKPQRHQGIQRTTDEINLALKG